MFVTTSIPLILSLFKFNLCTLQWVGVHLTSLTELTHMSSGHRVMTQKHQPTNFHFKDSSKYKTVKCYAVHQDILVQDNNLLIKEQTEHHKVWKINFFFLFHLTTVLQFQFEWAKSTTNPACSGEITHTLTTMCEIYSRVISPSPHRIFPTTFIYLQFDTLKQVQRKSTKPHILSPSD